MNQIEVKCQNCDVVSKSDNGYCEHCGYRMFGPRRNEVQTSKLDSQKTSNKNHTQTKRKMEEASS